MITLASDFGDPYPAAMTGVVARRTDARIVDVSHDLPRQDVRAGAFWLRFVLPEFPPAVHCAVVDPGVGTDRAALVVRAGGHALVGPDNGLLLPPARALAGETDEADAGGVADDGRAAADRGGDGDIEVFAVRVEDPASHTFHGRDVFAPVAADVHEVGVSALDRLPALSPASEFADLRFPDPAVRDDGARGEVLVVDGFGNVVTNLPGSVLTGVDTVRLAWDGNDDLPVAPSYAHVDPGQPLATVGSHGNVEFAVNRGRGDEALSLDPGDLVDLTW